MTNFDGNVSTISKAEDQKYDYVTYLKNGDGFLKIYFNDIEGNNAKVWYQDENGKFTNSLLLTRKAEEAVAGTSGKADDPTMAESKTETDEKPSSTGNSAGSTSGGSSGTSNSSPGSSGTSGSDKKEENCHYETIPAWTESVIVKDAWDEQVLVKDAWDETVQDCATYGQDSRDVAICNTCGNISYSGHDADTHGIETGHGSWHTDKEYYGNVKCLQYDSNIVHHDAEYNTIHHDAEYKNIQHPAEQKLVCE